MFLLDNLIEEFGLCILFLLLLISFGARFVPSIFSSKKIPKPPLLKFIFLSSLLASPAFGNLYPFLSIFSALSLAFLALSNFSFFNFSFNTLCSINFLFSFLNLSSFLFIFDILSISFFVNFLFFFLSLSISSSNSFCACSFILSMLSKFEIFFMYSSTFDNICLILSLFAIERYFAEAFLLSK